MKFLILFFLTVQAMAGITPVPTPTYLPAPSPTPESYEQEVCLVDAIIVNAGNTCGIYNFTTGVFTPTTITKGDYVKSAFQKLRKAKFILKIIPANHRAYEQCNATVAINRITSLLATLTPYYPKPTGTHTPWPTPRPSMTPRPTRTNTPNL